MASYKLDLWPLTSWPESWPFHAPGGWTTRTNLQQNQFIRFQNIMFTSLITDEWMDRRPENRITPLFACLAWRRHKTVCLCLATVKPAYKYKRKISLSNANLKTTADQKQDCESNKKFTRQREHWTNRTSTRYGWSPRVSEKLNRTNAITAKLQQWA